MKATPKKAASSSSDESSESSSEDEAPAKPKAAAAPASAKKAAPAKKAKSSSSDSDSDDSDSESSEAEASKIKKPIAAAKKDESSSDDSGSGSDSDSSSEDEDEDVEMADASKPKAPVAKSEFRQLLVMSTSTDALFFSAGKRKAEDDAPAPAKKAKIANGDAEGEGEGAGEVKTVFVGRLSWNVDNDWLAQEFAECGEVVSARVQMDRNTGRSRGFGYVTFATSAAVEAALQLSGKEIDGRPINVDKSEEKDRSTVRQNRAEKFGDKPSEPATTLFVGNLSFNSTEDGLWEVFGQYGDVKSVRLPTDRETGNPKGFGYVEFTDIESARKAFEGVTGTEIDGRAIRVDYSQPRDNSGGGFGARGGGGGRVSGVFSLAYRLRG